MKAKHGLMVLWGIVILAAFSAVVMLLWNSLMPDIFGLATINFLQALGLFALARILFGGFGIGHRMMMGRGMMASGHKHPFREKWMKMSEEERRAFIQKRHQFGHGHPFGREDHFRKSSCNPNDDREPGCGQ